MNFKEILKGKILLMLYFTLSGLLVFSFTVLLVQKMNDKPKAQIISERLDKPVIKDNTQVTREVTYICGDRLTGQIPAADLSGLDYQGVVKRFPEEEGWKLDDSEPGKLIITRSAPELCPVHRNYRHLGVSNGQLAVFEGPLGYDKKMLQLEKVMVENLPQDYKLELKQAARYNQQPIATKRKLKQELEFNSENLLNEAMESISEYSR